MEDLIDIKVFNKDHVLRYSFLVECEMDSLTFREIIDETLANGYDGWSCEASLLEESDNPLYLGC